MQGLPLPIPLQNDNFSTRDWEQNIVIIHVILNMF